MIDKFCPRYILHIRPVSQYDRDLSSPTVAPEWGSGLDCEGLIWNRVELWESLLAQWRNYRSIALESHRPIWIVFVLYWYTQRDLSVISMHLSNMFISFVRIDKESIIHTVLRNMFILRILSTMNSSSWQCCKMKKLYGEDVSRIICRSQDVQTPPSSSTDLRLDKRQMSTLILSILVSQWLLLVVFLFLLRGTLESWYSWYAIMSDVTRIVFCVFFVLHTRFCDISRIHENTDVSDF